ncbi:MAG: hypothetical protein IJU92_02395 [Spirochaetaceae bacterium]|nr:hypothetical protein [Spirochaetaceae bacterium]
MKLYSIKSAPNENSYFSILDKTNDGYKIKISREVDGYEKTNESFLNEDLFETCLRTGYICEISETNRPRAVAQ